MTFQSTVRADQGIGVPGEIVLDGPTRAQPCPIDPAATAANCVVGRMFSMDATSGLASPGSAGAVVAPGTHKLLGILAMPKNYALQGTSAGGTLAPTLTVQVGQLAEFVEMTAGIILSLPGAVKAGVQLQYHLPTGVISAPAVAGAADTGNAMIPGCSVDRVLTTGAGLVIAKLNGLQ